MEKKSTVGDTIRVFAETFDTILEARFKKIEDALESLEERIGSLEKQSRPPQITHQIIETPPPAPSIDAGDTEHSWYSLAVEQPTIIADNSPEHLVGVMYKIVNSKAISVKQYTATIRLDSKHKPVLYMLMYVNRPTIQSHFICGWNADEKDSVKCRKLKRLDLVVDEFKKLKSGAEDPSVISYISRYPAIFAGERWGSLTQEFILKSNIKH